MSRTILIDDLRDIEADVICRTPIAAYLAIELEFFDDYIFDHDLGETAPGTSGYDILNWGLETKNIKNDARIILVTSNPVGRERMEHVLRYYGYKREQFYWRHK